MKHILLDILSTWAFTFFSIFIGFRLNSVEILFFSTFLLIYDFIRTLRWLAFLYDKIFKAKVTVKTKGFRYLTRERVYMLDISKKIYYSVLVFDDTRLKGKFVLVDNNCIFRNGEQIEVTYYKNSKVIETISVV